VNVDFIILGQGLCGTLLSYELMCRGKSVLVVDDGNPQSSSRVAAGLINPVTGKRYVKSWMYERLLDAALTTYAALEEALQVPLARPAELIQFHKNDAEQNAFLHRAETTDELRPADESAWSSLFRIVAGAGTIAPCYTIDAAALLNNWRIKLKAEGCLLEERFDWSLCRAGDIVTYGNWHAKKLICCDGAGSFSNPYFSILPFSLNKGEALIADIPGLSGSYIYKHDFKIIPISSGLFWIGSSFEWAYPDVQPTMQFRSKAEAWMKSFCRLGFTVREHLASERPSSIDHKPFIGLHPVYPSVGIFNGMGTKAFSQAPFFATEFANHLCYAGSITPDADICRFKKLLGKFYKS